MSQDLEAVWEQLAADASARPGAGTMSIRVEPDSMLDLHATVTSPDGRRGLTMGVASDAVVGLGEPPASVGLEHLMLESGADRRDIVLRLSDASANELFEALARDLLHVVGRARSDEEGVRLWMGRVAQWRQVFANGRTGLSPNRQRGLYAELWMIREHMIPAVGPAAALAGWQGPIGGRDLQFPGASIEVKSSAATEPQAVRINSERQLDTIGCPRLYLAHVSLAVEAGKGETLPQMVESMRGLVAGSAGAVLLEDGLLGVGYLAAHESRYQRVGYAIRRESFFEVRDDFPRILESDLPPGVGNVRYDLVLDVCEPFRVESDAVAAGLLEGSE
jgi:hypothetical protein